MKIALHTTLDGRQHEPLAEYLAGVGQALEERGFSSVWIAEHVVTFKQFDPKYPYPYADGGVIPPFMPEIGIVDPLTVLTALAMATKTIRLGSGVAILPQRNPVYFAKMATGIDLLSNGRFVAGVGLGWTAQEYEALQTPFEHRGSRMRDYLQVVRSLWCDEVSSFEGPYYRLPECIQLPKPVQKPHPPFFFGGEGEPAMRRVAEFGGGWIAFRLTPDELAARLPMLEDMLAQRGRSLADIEITLSPVDKPCGPDELRRFAELGVAELIIPVAADSLASFRQQVDQIAETWMPLARTL